MLRSTLLYRHLGRALLFVAALAGYVLPAHAESSFTRHHLATHDYWVYQPASYTPGQAVPLVVYLHGCGEEVSDVAVGTRWNQQAEQGNFIVLYPDQNRLAQPAKCWNWYTPGQLQRGQGEGKLIADMTQEVMANWNIDARRVYVLGFSAGGAMSSVMATDYPDLYAAAGMFAGCGYDSCADLLNGQQAYAAMGSYARTVPAIIIGGTSDPAYLGVLDTVQQWRATNDLADDGLANDSVPRNPASTSYSPGDVYTHPYSLAHYTDRLGRPLIDFYSVYGATHLYYGGDPAAPFTDPWGPGVTPSAYAFFMAHPMP